MTGGNPKMQNSSRGTGLKRALVSAAAFLLLVTSAAALAQGRDTRNNPVEVEDFTPVTDEMLLNPAPENWMAWRNGYASWGHSYLDQINKIGRASCRERESDEV